MIILVAVLISNVLAIIAIKHTDETKKELTALIGMKAIDKVLAENDTSLYESKKDVVKSFCEPISLSERELIERVVAAEARGEEHLGKVAVAQTIKDRGDLWGMTYTEVCLAPNQYAPAYQGEISDDVKLAVSEVFDYGYRAFEEPVTHFHSGSVSPSWANEKVNRGAIGSHRFYY